MRLEVLVSACVALLLMSGCGPAARPAPSEPIVRRVCRDTPPPPGRTERAVPGPSVEELATIVQEHRPATLQVPVEHGVPTVPIDWRTLPTTAVLWSEAGDTEPLLIDDTLVTMEPGDEAIVARDARSGAERWRVPTPHRTGERPYAVAGCGRVVLFSSERVAGLDPATGAAGWEIPLEPNRSSVMSHPGHASMNGCHLAFHVADDAMRLADGFDTARVRLVDVRSGAITARPTCTTRCAIVSAECEGVIVNTSENERWLFPWEGGEATRLPTGTDALVPGLAIEIDDEIVARDRISGATRWRSEVRARSGPLLRSGLLARTGDDFVVRDGDALVRISGAAGRELWRTPVSEEIARAIARDDGRSHDDARLVIGSRVEPQVLLEVDLATGLLRSLRISAIDPVSVALEGDLVAVRSHGRFGVVDLSLDAPALRERLTLEDDVERALIELTAGRRGPGGPPWGYPRGRDEALEWLHRLRPLTGDVVTSRIESSELGTASALLAALDGTPEANAMAISVLERTYGCPPTERLAWIRRAAAAALEPGLDGAQADELGRETIAWLDDLQARRSARPPTDEDHAAWDAVLVGRDALLRASASSAPLRAFEEAIRRHAPAPTERRCEPSDDDAARAAVLRYGYELGTSPGATVLVPGATCIEVPTLGGPLEVVMEGPSSPPWMSIGHPEVVTDLGEHGDHAPLPWPDAPARAIDLHFYSGPLAAQGDRVIVQRVDGVWRVVWTTMLWVS